MFDNGIQSPPFFGQMSIGVTYDCTILTIHLQIDLSDVIGTFHGLWVLILFNGKWWLTNDVLFSDSHMDLENSSVDHWGTLARFLIFAQLSFEHWFLLWACFPLSKETIFEFPVIWLVENSLFLWDFFWKLSLSHKNRFWDQISVDGEPSYSKST